MLDKIRIVLVSTSHPGNIGAAARAMKTMGLSKLYLVTPNAFPHPIANSMASNADDILDNAIVTETLTEALTGCHLAIGTSARHRTLDLSLITPHECGETLLESITHHDTEVALVFGREQTGLTNEELLMCQYHVTINSNPDYSSLNLAAAVQVLCYEIRLSYLETITPPPPVGTSPHKGGRDSENRPLAPIEDIERFYEHLETILNEVGFIKNATLMPKVRRLFNRTQLENSEVQFLRGMLTSVQKKFSPSHKE